MKKINLKPLMAATLLSVAISSCTDLDVNVNSKYTEYPDSEIAIDAKISGVLYEFRGPLGRRYSEAQALSSDEAMALTFDGGWLDSYNYVHASHHLSNSADAHLDWYGVLSGGITKCNRLIVELGGDKADPAIVASIRAARAFYHFILMDSYANIPILDHALAEDEAAVQSTRPEVARWIESELLAIKNDLTKEVNAATYGKPTYWMANALLAKLYINWAVYTSEDVAQYDPSTTRNEKLDACVAVCDEIIQSGKFDLTDGFRKKFFADNGPHIKDFIYAMPYDRETQQGNTYARFRIFKAGDTNGEGGPGLFGVVTPQGFGGIFAMTPEFANLFSLEGDERNDAVLRDQVYIYDPASYAPTTTPYVYKGQPVVMSKNPAVSNDGTNNVGDNFKGWCQGWRSNKFYMDLQTTAGQSRNQSNDIPIFRYADILLQKAEAITRGATATNGDTPKSLFNQIRNYVHAPLIDKDPTLQDLIDERGREFFDENWRRNDLIRFGMFENDWANKNVINPDAKTQKFRRIFPIHKDIMEQNTNWKQNPGY